MPDKYVQTFRIYNCEMIIKQWLVKQLCVYNLRAANPFLCCPLYSVLFAAHTVRYACTYSVHMSIGMRFFHGNDKVNDTIRLRVFHWICIIRHKNKIMLSQQQIQRPSVELCYSVFKIKKNPITTNKIIKNIFDIMRCHCVLGIM